MDCYVVKMTKLTEQSNDVQMPLCVGPLGEYNCKSGHSLNVQFTHTPQKHT